MTNDVMNEIQSMKKGNDMQKQHKSLLARGKAMLSHCARRDNKGSRQLASQPQDTTTPASTVETVAGHPYFIEARSWADDLYTRAIVTKNRYKLAFYVMAGVTVLLSIAINGLVPLQHLSPLLVEHYEDGHVTVKPLNDLAKPSSPEQTKSDLVRYVTNRESYHPTSYNAQYSLVDLLSGNDVAITYHRTQSSHNPQAPINQLGSQGYRTVHIESVVFMDADNQNDGKPAASRTHHNTAEVYFTITDHQRGSAKTHTIPMLAVMSWDYQGMPDNQEDAWRNWNGFTVTHYQVAQRSLSN